MKIRSLLLGSIAAAGLSTGAFAADFSDEILTALDLCDALGISGVTISSDKNCVQLSAEVKYEFNWGDYRGSINVVPLGDGYGNATIPDNDNETGSFPGATLRDMDWSSRVDMYLKVVGTADTDVGPAKAVIKIKQTDQQQTRNENNSGPNGITEGGLVDLPAAPPVVAVPAPTPSVAKYRVFVALDTTDGTPLYNIYDAGGNQLVGGYDAAGVYVGAPALLSAIDDHAATGSDHTGSNAVVIDEAYVQIGGATVLMAGKKGSILNKDDDAPFTWQNLYLSSAVDTGVFWTKDKLPTGGHVIQVVSDLGNGLWIKAGLENLQATGPAAGTGVLVFEYAGDNITAHASFAAGGLLDGVVENYGVHAGITATFDPVKIRAAVAMDETGYWNALASAEATFDIFTLAVAGEANRATNVALTDWGAAASGKVTVVDGVTLNVGGRFYNDADTGDQAWHVAGSVVAAVTDTITLTGEVGVVGSNMNPVLQDVYGKATLEWKPGGDFTASIAGEVRQDGAYKATFKASKLVE